MLARTIEINPNVTARSATMNYTLAWHGGHGPAGTGAACLAAVTGNHAGRSPAVASASAALSGGDDAFS
jgi:hypothetical protein